MDALLRPLYRRCWGPPLIPIVVVVVVALCFPSRCLPEGRVDGDGDDDDDGDNDNGDDGDDGDGDDAGAVA
jgi:hypothetical protein